jgi:glucosamine--fructose-6-phosphate aminotransferase (isomerizing)
MASEIAEIPAVLERQLAEGREEIAAAVAAIEAASPNWVAIVGRGTSDHAATYGRYLFEAIVGLPTSLAAPSITSVYGAPLDWHGGIVIAVSQSGASPDVIAVVEAARSAGAVTIAVTNSPASELAAAAAWTIDCRAGPERSVAATKTYVAELAAIASLVAGLRPGAGLRSGLMGLPAATAGAIRQAAAWLAATTIADAMASVDRALVVSRGYNLATALEIALKLKETCGIFAEGYSTADLQHGPVALAGDDVPILAIRPTGEMGVRVDDVLARLPAMGGGPWWIGSAAGSRAAGRRLGDHEPLRLDVSLPDALTPLPYVIPGQLLAESVARRRGLDPDRPAGLSKVTRTL